MARPAPLLALLLLLLLGCADVAAARSGANATAPPSTVELGDGGNDVYDNGGRCGRPLPLRATQPALRRTPLRRAQLL